jgi:hypothetical protein
MKQVKLYFPALISLCLILLLTLIFTNELKKNKETDESKEEQQVLLIETSELNNCDSLQVYNDYITLDCLSDINYLKDNNKISLKDALNTIKITDITDQMDKEIDKLTNDKIYTDNKKISNNGLKIIECNNGLYIIGKLDLEYNNKLCA